MKKKGVSVAINNLINTLLLSSNGPSRRADGTVAAEGKTFLLSKLEALKEKNCKKREFS